MKKRINYPKEENESSENEEKSKKEKQKKLKNRNNKNDKNTKNDKIYQKKETNKTKKKKMKNNSENKKDNYIENNNANEQILIITEENKAKPEIEKDILEIQDKMPKEEKENIMKYIIEDLEQDKIFYLNFCEEELNKSIKEKLKKTKKKVTSVEVDENLEEISNEKEYDNNSISIYEVKNKKFPLDGKIEKQVLYEGKLFNEDRHQPSNYPDTINYRCINFRKQERNLNTNFCNAILKRKIGKNFYYYILEKNHTKSCQELVEIKKKYKQI